MKRIRNQKTIEFGDFQTPITLVSRIMDLLIQIGISPASIIEPTCGTGSFVISARKYFPKTKVIAIDINSNHLKKLKNELENKKLFYEIELENLDFFTIDWTNKVNTLERPILILGNPPWVTSSDIGRLKGNNLPIKKNIHDFSGLEAKTGKSNFDISEYVLIDLIKALNGHNGTIAMLCKANVARKVFQYCVKQNFMISSYNIYYFNTKKYFDISIDACLFICILNPGTYNENCQIYQDLDKKTLIHEIGCFNKKLVANIALYKNWKYLQKQTIDKTEKYVWRSGIKHDCTRIMELKKLNDSLINGFGEHVCIEEEYLFPLLKGTNIANNQIHKTERWMIVTQKKIQEDTSIIGKKAPRTWRYLEKHSDLLNSRSSSVYKNRPKYSLFGIGDYTFSSWKVAISGFHKKLYFRLITPLYNKPVVFDDTCYFLALDSFEEATIIHTILNHHVATEFYNAFIFWDMKRPITKQILQKLDFYTLIQEISSNEILELINQQDKNLNSESLQKVFKNFSNSS